jgi:hypothetical protein
MTAVIPRPVAAWSDLSHSEIGWDGGADLSTPRSVEQQGAHIGLQNRIAQSLFVDFDCDAILPASDKRVQAGRRHGRRGRLGCRSGRRGRQERGVKQIAGDRQRQSAEQFSPRR